MKRTQNVVHTSKLRPYIRREGECGALKAVIDANGNVEQEVKAILEHRRVNPRCNYLVQFEGNPVFEAIYLPQTELKNCIELVRDFENSITELGAAVTT